MMTDRYLNKLSPRIGSLCAAEVSRPLRRSLPFVLTEAKRLLESEIPAARAEEQAKALTLKLEALKQRRRWLRRRPKA